MTPFAPSRVWKPEHPRRMRLKAGFTPADRALVLQLRRRRAPNTPARPRSATAPGAGTALKVEITGVNSVAALKSALEAPNKAFSGLYKAKRFTPPILGTRRKCDEGEPTFAGRVLKRGCKHGRAVLRERRQRMRTADRSETRNDRFAV